METGKNLSIKRTSFLYFEVNNISIVFYIYLNGRRKWNTCSISSKTKFQPDLKIKLFFFPNSLVFCLLGFLGSGGSGVCFVFLIIESQKSICPFKEVHYDNPISLYLLTGLKRKILTVPKQSSVLTETVASFIFQIRTWNLSHQQIIRVLCRIIYTYFASQPVGVKSSLCLVLKMKFLVRISRIDGGCRGVATANRASWGDKVAPSFPFLFCPWRNFNRPWKFIALDEEKSNCYMLEIVKSKIFLLWCKTLLFFFKTHQIQALQHGIHECQLTGTEHCCYTPECVILRSTNKL